MSVATARPRGPARGGRTALGLAALATFAAGCCCQPPLEERVRRLERENERLRFEIDATEQALSAARDYEAELEKGGGRLEPLYSLYLADSDLASMARQSLPYRVPAREFDRNLDGEIVVERLDGFGLHAGNRLTCRLHFRGRNVEYKGSVPSAFKEHVRRFTEGIEAGAVVDLVVFLSREKGKVRVLSEARGAKLLKNSDPRYEGELVKAMNRRALREPLVLDLHIARRSAKLTRLLVTGNHVVVGYEP